MNKTKRGPFFTEHHVQLSEVQLGSGPGPIEVTVQK